MKEKASVIKITEEELKQYAEEVDKFEQEVAALTNKYNLSVYDTIFYFMSCFYHMADELEATARERENTPSSQIIIKDAILIQKKMKEIYLELNLPEAKVFRSFKGN